MSREIKHPFYVTCTSSKCKEFYPENKTSAFTTRLREPILLNNADRKWEVGVSWFTSPQSINNFGPCMLMEFYVYDGAQVHAIPLEDQHVSNVDDILDALDGALARYIEQWEDYIPTEKEFLEWEAQKEQDEENVDIRRKRKRSLTDGDDSTEAFEKQFEFYTYRTYINCVKKLLAAILTASTRYLAVNSPIFKFSAQYHMYISAYTHYKIGKIWKNHYDMMMKTYRGKQLDLYKDVSIYDIMRKLNYKLYNIIKYCRDYHDIYMECLTTDLCIEQTEGDVRFKIIELQDDINKMEWGKLGEYKNCRDDAEVVARDMIMGMSIYTTVVARYGYDVKDVVKLHTIDGEFQKIKLWSGVLKDALENKEIETYYEYLPYILHAGILLAYYDMNVERVITEKYKTIYEARSTEHAIKVPKGTSQEDLYLLTKTNIEDSVNTVFDLLNDDLAASDEKNVLDRERFSLFRNVKRQWKENVVSESQAEMFKQQDLWVLNWYWAKGDMVTVESIMRRAEPWLLAEYEKLQGEQQAQLQKEMQTRELERQKQEVMETNEKERAAKEQVVAEDGALAVVAAAVISKEVDSKDKVDSGQQAPAVDIMQDKLEPRVPRPRDKDDRAVGQEGIIPLVVLAQTTSDTAPPTQQAIVPPDEKEGDEDDQEDAYDDTVQGGVAVLDEKIVFQSNIRITPEMYNMPPKNKRDRRKRKRITSPLYTNLITFEVVDTDHVKISFALTHMDFAMSPTLLKAIGFMDYPQYTLEAMNERIRFKKWFQMTRNTDRAKKLYAVYQDMESVGLQEYFSKKNFFRRHQKYKSEQIDFQQFEYSLQDTLHRKNIGFNEYITQKLLTKKEYLQMVKLFQRERFPFIDLVMYKLMKDLPFISVTGTNPVNFTPADLVFIYTNIIEPEYVDNTRMRLLDILSIRSVGDDKFDQIEFSNTHYKTVDVDVLSDIEFLIATSLGVPVPFRYGPATIQLHFRKRK